MLNEDQIVIEDLNFWMRQEQGEEYVVETETPTVKNKHARLGNYKVEEDVVLCHARRMYRLMRIRAGLRSTITTQ